MQDQMDNCIAKCKQTFIIKKQINDIYISSILNDIRSADYM